MQQIPKENNLVNSASIQMLLDALKNEESAEVHAKIAYLLFKRKSLGKANKHCRAALRLEDDTDVAFLYGSVLQAQDSIPEADSIYRSILSHTPTHWKSRREMAKLDLQNGNLLSSKNHILLLEKLIPNEAQLFDLKGSWAMAQYDTTNALKNFRKAIKLDPKYIPTYQHLSKLFNTIELPYKALSWSRKGLKVDPINDTLFLQKGYAFLRLKNRDSARVAFENANQYNPKLFDASYQIALIAYKNRQFEKSLKYIKYALDYGAHAKYNKIHFYEGICLQKIGKKKEAISAYKKAIKDDPANLIAQQYYYQLSKLLQLERAQFKADSITKAYQKRLAEQNNK